MARRIQIEKKTTETKTEEAIEEVEAHIPENAQELMDELDELMASIDEALGENLDLAQDFVMNFIQKGGQ